MKKKIIYFVEVLLILLGIALLFVKGDTVSLSENDFYETSDGSIVSDAFYLKRGIYNIKLYYDADVDYTNTVKVYVDNETYNSLKTNQVLLYENLNESSYNFSLSHSNGTLHIMASYGGEGKLEVYGADLIPTNIPARMFVFWVVIFSSLINSVLLGIKKGFFTLENKKITLSICGIILVNSIPMMLNYIVSGGDLGYHYMRIQALADGLADGQFPVRIFSKWLFGYGYADAVMYGHALLYIPAFMRLLGFSISFSYKTLLFTVNVLTAVIGYFSFNKAFGDKKGAILGTALYCFMPYRLFTLYTAANVGVFSAATFLPLVFAGLYRIFSQNVTERDFKYNWTYVAIGLSCIISNHTLSTEITCGFIVLVCIVMIKKVFTKKRFMELLKALVGFILLSLWFIVPFVDNYLNYDFHVKNVSARQIQYRGILPTQFFTVFMKLSYHDFYGEDGLQEATIMSNGMALTIALIAFVVIWILFKEFRKEKECKEGVIIAGLSAIAAFMCTLYFPWDWIQNLNGLCATLVSSLQFPTRFIAYLGILLAALSIIVYKFLYKKDKKFGTAYFCGVLVLSIITVASFSTENSYYNNSSRLYDTTEMGTGYTSGGEYLPQSIYGLSNTVLKFRDAIADDGVEISDYSKQVSSLNMTVINNNNYESYVDVPFLNYIGYKATDTKTGEKFELIDGNNAEIRVVLPANYSGTIEVEYTGKWYWKISDVISLLSILAFIVLNIRSRRVKLVENNG